MAVHWWIQYSTRDVPLSVQFLSSSCSFWQISFQIMGWHIPCEFTAPPCEILDPPLKQQGTCTVFTFLGLMQSLDQLLDEVSQSQIQGT